MTEKLNLSENGNLPKSDWEKMADDEMEKFRKYVEFINQKRAAAKAAETAPKPESAPEPKPESKPKPKPELKPEQTPEPEPSFTSFDFASNREIDKQKEIEIEKAKEVEIAKAKEELYQVSQELMENERLQDEVELYQTTQELMELETAQDKKDLYDTVQELTELENKQDQDELYQVTQELLTLENAGKGDDTAAIATPKEEITPLTAINADWTHDRHELAHDLAEQTLNAEVAEGNIIKKLWKGTLFKKYYEKKYTNEFITGQRTDEKGRTIRDIIREESPDVMERFVLGATEDMRYIHQQIGKKNKDGSFDGEKLIPADEKTNEEIKQAIIDYARKTLEPGQKVEDLDREFLNNTGRIMEEAVLDGRISKGYKRTNYLETAREAARRYEKVAINAKNKAMQDEAMSMVMAGFQVYNAEVRNNVRTEAHRDNLDKIVNALESSKIGQFIPAEIIAGAVGAVAGLTQTGARAIFGAAGGIAASSILSGLKERNRITEDRARMMRDIANGKDYGGNQKTAKYEQRIGGTLYDIEKATDLTSKIKVAIDYEGEGRGKMLMQAIAEARVRVDFSDSEQKDLISYSSASSRGKERLELDKMLIRAERALNEKGKKDYELMQAEIRERIIKGYEDESGEHHAGVEEKDQQFKNFRTVAAVKKAGKTLALGATIFLGSQEIMAAIDPNKIGIFEKAGLFDKLGIKTPQNNLDAKETLLARSLGQGSYTKAGSVTEEVRQNLTNPEEIKRLEAEGYHKVKIENAWSEPKEAVAEVDPSASTARVDVKYDGWASEGNISTHLENGKFTSTIEGAATANGQSLNYNSDNLKAFITIGDSKFEIAGTPDETGQIVWSEGGVFTTTTGESIKAIGDNGEKLYKYFELAVDNGSSDGVKHITALATDVGTDSFSGKITQTVTETIDHPAVYSMVRAVSTPGETIARGLDLNGLGFAPETTRTGLGRANSAPETPVEAPESVSTPPEPENTANAPEAAPAESSEETPTILANAPEAIRTFATDYENAILDRRAEIGNDLAYDLLSDQPLTQEKQMSWADSIRNLSPDGKNALREIIEMRDSLPTSEKRLINFGNALSAFLASNPNLLQ